MKALESFAKNIESNLEISGVVGIDFTVILTILPMLLQLFQSCKAPVPPNPNPSPTPSEQKAWELKCTATSAYDETQADYSRPVLHRMATHIRRQKKKKDGEPISRSDALELARASLDEARTAPIEEIAAGIEEVGE